jgi:hypothetical protein
MKESERERERRRWINLGEIIAMGALIVSALGVWISWKSADRQGPTTVIEKRQSIPLTLRATADRDGRTLVISPVESSHALESMTLALKGHSIDVGSDGRLDADSVAAALGDSDKDSKAVHSVPVRIETRYIEAGADKKASGNYRLSYRWEGGGLFGGHSLRLVSLSRA